MRKQGHLYKGRTILATLAVVGTLAGFSGAAVAGPVINGDMIGVASTTYTVKKHESLFDIARRFDVGIIELEAANPGVNPYKPKVGTEIKITSQHVIPSITHDGIVVNLDASRLYYFKSPTEVLTFPVASGKEGWETPVAATKVTEKRLHPTWTIPADIRAEDPKLPESIPPGPGNPLGDYALALGLDGIMIHGTTSPASIGRHASHGCIRMYPEDIESLFNAVKRGTPVLIARMPYVMGWEGNKLLLQVTPRVHAAPVKSAKAAAKPEPDKLLHEAVARAAGNATIDWDAVDAAMARADGLPAEIGARSLFGPPVPEAMMKQPVVPVAPAIEAPKPVQHAALRQPAAPVLASAKPVMQHAALTIINDGN